MNDPLKFPKLRWPLDIKFEKVEGQEIFLMRCPIGISKEPLLLVPAVAPIVGSFDGSQSVDAIVSKFSSYGVNLELVNELVGLLDKHLFLESPLFLNAQSQVRLDFKNAAIREAALAGLGYSADAASLKRELKGYLAAGSAAKKAHTGQLLCLISPHIDYRRGQLCYGQTYNYLKEEEHDLYILAGTSHQYSPHMFHLSSKDFQNPLGRLPCDRDFVEKLSKLYGFERSFADEFLHRREHSLELQIPFLSYFKNEPKIVPILVGSFQHMLNSSKAPSSFEEYENFAAALSEVVKLRMAAGQRICFVAGVDMAHVGRYFGDSGSLSDQFMEQIALRDQAYLDALKKGNKQELFEHIEEDNDKRRICGFPTMYLLLDLFERLELKYKAQLYDYRQAVDLQNDCAVTFAGMGLYTD